MHFTKAITRTPANTFAKGLTKGEGQPNLGLALAQHAAYVQALRDLGVEVTLLSPDDQFPDSTFVEDVGLMTARVHIQTRPGAPERRVEVEALWTQIPTNPNQRSITAPGTLDGGDVCQIENLFLIGISDRTNEEGARQLSTILEEFGYAAVAIDIRGQSNLLHLKSGISYLGEGRVIAVPELAKNPLLSRMKLFIPESDENYAANAVRVNDSVLFAKGYPQLEAQLMADGLKLVFLETSEFRKMDGGLSCLSLRF